MSFKKELKGMVLITVLLLTVLLILMTVSMIFISTNHLSIMGNIEAKEKALKAAEAGVAYAIYELNFNPAWGLSGDPNFPGGAKIDKSDNSTWPTFTRGTNTIEEDYSSDCRFYISFDSSVSNIRDLSVNNLFNPAEESNSETPAYTAKIVSTGKCVSGSQEKASRTLVAFLVRSDYSPYSINVTDKARFVEMNGDINIYGKTDSDPGFIYSGSRDPNASISAGDCANVNTNKGVVSARGGIELPDSFDGVKLENITRDYSFGDIDIDGILNNAKAGDYGPLSTVGSGEVSLLSNIEWKLGHYYSYVRFSSTAAGFNSAVSSIENGPGTAVVKLERDLYVQGDPSEVFKIIGNPVILEQEHRKGFYTGDPPSPTSTFINNGTRITYLDLNGHSIYSDCSLMFGIDVIGEGRIYSKGNVHYRIGVNTDEIITAARGELKIEISKFNVSTSQSKGLYYSEGDIIIQPIESDSELLIEGEGETDDVQEYEVSTPFTEPDGKKVTVGHYVDPEGYWDKGIWKDPPPYYEGNNMKVTKWLEDSGDYMLIAKGKKNNKNLQICLDYDGHKNIDFGDYNVGVVPEDTGLEVKLVDNDGNILSPVPDLSEIGITAAQLDDFGAEILHYFENFSNNVDINVTGTIGGLKGLVFDPGSEGNITINFYPDYANSIVNIQRKMFTVRKISSHEI